MKIVSVEDIAHKAGVSCSMVYRVMNGKVNSANKKHLKVRKLLQDTGYSKQRIKTKGNILCISDVDTQHAVELASFLEKIVREEGFEFMSVHSPGSNINSFIDRFNISGVIFISRRPEEELFIPTVILNKSIYSGQYSFVDSDEMTGLVKVLTLLHRSGHKNVGFFNDHVRPGLYPHPRRFFIPQAYEISGFNFDERMIYKADFGVNEHPKAIADAVNYFLNLPETPTAILLPGSNYAPCFYEETRKKGLEIPKDMSFLGVDDTDVSMTISPFLTTLRKPMEEMARVAFKLLIERTCNPNLPNQRILIEPEIVERESIAFIK